MNIIRETMIEEIEVRFSLIRRQRELLDSVSIVGIDPYFQQLVFAANFQFQNISGGVTNLLGRLQVNNILDEQTLVQLGFDKSSLFAQMNVFSELVISLTAIQGDIRRRRRLATETRYPPTRNIQVSATQRIVRANKKIKKKTKKPKPIRYVEDTINLRIKKQSSQDQIQEKTSSIEVKVDFPELPLRDYYHHESEELQALRIQRPGIEQWIETPYDHDMYIEDPWVPSEALSVLSSVNESLHGVNYCMQGRAYEMDVQLLWDTYDPSFFCNRRINFVKLMYRQVCGYSYNEWRELKRVLGRRLSPLTVFNLTEREVFSYLQLPFYDAINDFNLLEHQQLLRYEKFVRYYELYRYLNDQQMINQIDKFQSSLEDYHAFVNKVQDEMVGEDYSEWFRNVFNYSPRGVYGIMLKYVKTQSIINTLEYLMGRLGGDHSFYLRNYYQQQQLDDIRKGFEDIRVDSCVIDEVILNFQKLVFNMISTHQKITQESFLAIGVIFYQKMVSMSNKETLIYKAFERLNGVFNEFRDAFQKENELNGDGIRPQCQIHCMTVYQEYVDIMQRNQELAQQRIDEQEEYVSFQEQILSDEHDNISADVDIDVFMGRVPPQQQDEEEQENNMQVVLVNGQEDGQVLAIQQYDIPGGEVRLTRELQPDEVTLLFREMGYERFSQFNNDLQQIIMFEWDGERGLYYNRDTGMVYNTNDNIGEVFNVE